MKTKILNSHNRTACTYLLTPSGFEEKAQIAVRFLKQRIKEYEQIKQEIAELEAGVLGAKTDLNTGEDS